MELQEDRKNYNCNFLTDFSFNEESNKFIDLYTGKTNMKNMKERENKKR